MVSVCPRAKGGNSVYFEPPATLLDRDPCGTISARDQTCRGTQEGAPYFPPVLPSPVSTLPQLHPTNLPFSGGSSSSPVWLLRQANNLLLWVKVCQTGNPNGSVIQTAGRARVGKQKPKDLDFEQLHWPGAEFVLYFGHCHCFILKGGGGALILKIGVGSPCLSPSAPERDSSPQFWTAVTGPQKSPA